MLNKIIEAIDDTNDLLGKMCSWLTFLMVLLMCLNVFQRYVLGMNYVWQQELVGFLHAMAFMGVAGYSYRHNAHVRVDVCYQHFSPSLKALIDMLGVILLLWPLCIALLIFSLPFVRNAWSILEASTEYQGMPGVFILKSFIWVFALTLFLQGIAVCCRSITVWRGTHG